MGKAILGIILGGVIAHAWGALSWMVLPFHSDTIHSFPDEKKLIAFAEETFKERGVYYSPQPSEGSMQKAGPRIFASYHPGPDTPSMGMLIVRALSANLICAVIIGILLSAAAPRLNFIGRLFFVTMIGAFAAIAGVYPNNIWWEFPNLFTSLAMLDLVIGWFLAGIAMAALIRG
ncbi:MAG: hypothetical protein AAF226_03255 [Verrucomicrobiota bacterium]